MNVLVVDDEPLARSRLLRMLQEIEYIEETHEARDAEEALEQVGRHEIDAVLLDIRMPGLDGMQLAMSGALPSVIFTTAYDEYALHAFEASAVDYLMKPIQKDRLRAALAKVRALPAPNKSAPGHLASLLEQLLRERKEEIPRVTARTGKTLRVFDARDIARFRASDRYTLCRHQGQEFVLDDSLSSLEKKLSEHGFLRVHRAELVNLKHVQALRLEDGSTNVVLTDDQSAPVSRRMLAELKRRLGIQENSS